MSDFLIPSLVSLAALAVSGMACTWLRSGGHRYPLEKNKDAGRFGWTVPAAGGFSFLVSLSNMNSPAYSLVACMSIVALVILSSIDLDVHRLPDAWTLRLMLAVPAGVVVAGILDGQRSASLRSILGGLALGVFYAVVVVLGEIVTTGGMGLGDLKLAPTLGVLMGYHSWGHIVVGTFIAFVGASLAGVVLMLFRGALRNAALAFGPFMVAGTVLVLAAPSLTLIWG